MIYWGNSPNWDYAGIHDFLSNMGKKVMNSPEKKKSWEILEFLFVSAYLHTGWPLFEFELLLKFEEPSHFSNSSNLACSARFEEITAQKPSGNCTLGHIY